MGYQVEGLEYSRELVDELKKVVPDVPVRWGDATRIEVGDSSYEAYISLRVMEHRVEGPESFLKECFRVLRPGGIAFISVPFYDCLWKLRSPWIPVGWPEVSQGERFFQWHFTRREFVFLLREAGLEFVATGSSGVRYGALRSVPLWNWIYHRRGGYRIWRWLSFVEYALPWCGWMQWAVARKP
jgi:SAM-dependent methyltransferase